MMPLKVVSLASFITPPFKIQDVMCGKAVVRLVVVVREEWNSGWGLKRFKLQRMQYFLKIISKAITGDVISWLDVCG